MLKSPNIHNDYTVLEHYVQDFFIYSMTHRKISSSFKKKKLFCLAGHSLQP